jgi:hypothetical protein
VGKSEVIRTRMGKHNRSLIVAVYGRLVQYDTLQITVETGTVKNTTTTVASCGIKNCSFCRILTRINRPASILGPSMIKMILFISSSCN